MGLIRKNLTYSVLLTGAHYLFPLLVYPYVSRVLGVSGIGVVGFVDSIVTYFILFSMMGISIAGMRATAQCRSDRSRLSETFFSLLALNGILTLVALAAMIVLTLLVPELRQNMKLMGVGMCKLILNMFLVEWFYRGLEDFRYITMRSLAIRGAYVVAVFLFVRRPEDVTIYYFLTMLVVAETAVFNMSKSKEFVEWRRPVISLRKYVRPFFSFGLYMLLTTAYTTLNVAWLGFESGDTEVGYYMTATKVVTILLSVYAAVAYVMLPRMSSLAAAGAERGVRLVTRRSLLWLGLVAIPVVVCLELFAPVIIQLLAGNGYEGAVMPLRVASAFLIFAGLEQLLVWQMLIPLGLDRQLTIVTALSAALAVVLNLLLVRSYGAIGSALVWGVSETLIFAGACLVVINRQNIKAADSFN